MKAVLKWVSLVGLTSISLTSYATTNSKDTTYITIPSTPKIEVNVGAIWLKPAASNLNYVILNKELPAQSPTWDEQEIQPKFDPGFELGAKYLFGNASNNDIHLDWTHLDSTTNEALTAPSASYFLGPDYQIGPGGIPIRNATGKANFRYDVVNLDAGQLFNLGIIQLRLFGGLSDGFLRENVTSTYSGNLVVPSGPYYLNQEVKSRFDGVGPRFGFDVNYNNSYGLGFLGEAAASALIGAQQTKTQIFASSPALMATYGQALNTQHISDQNVYQVIPAFDAKLGVNFKCHFHTNALFTISAGYQAAVYVNAISQYIPASLVVPLQIGGIYVATMSHTLSNYSVHGPFLDLAVEM